MSADWTRSGAFSVPVLMYHSISDGPGRLHRAGEFRLQMNILEEIGYRVVSLMDLCDGLRDRRNIAAAFTAIDIRRRFPDFATTAFPELHKAELARDGFLPRVTSGGTDRWETSSRSGHRRRDGLADDREASRRRSRFRRARRRAS